MWTRYYTAAKYYFKNIIIWKKKLFSILLLWQFINDYAMCINTVVYGVFRKMNGCGVERHKTFLNNYKMYQIIV